MWVCGHKTELRLRQQGFCYENFLYNAVKSVVTNSPFIPQTAVIKSFLLHFNTISLYSFLMFHKGKTGVSLEHFPPPVLFLEEKGDRKTKIVCFLIHLFLLTSSQVVLVLNKDIIYISISSPHRVHTKLSVFQLFKVRIL